MSMVPKAAAGSYRAGPVGNTGKAFIRDLILFTLLLGLLPRAESADWVPVTGKVTFGDTPLCAMVLANGQNMFSCSGDGSFNLSVPLDGNGQVTFFTFAQGFAPFRQVLSPAQAASVNIDLVREPESRSLSVSYGIIDATRSGWKQISGRIDFNGTSVCALILANGQHMFSCNENLGRFSLEVPPDLNSNVTLFAFVSGFQPLKVVIPDSFTTGGPFGGLINSMVIDSQGRLFVATGSSGCNGYSCGRNGIFRSTDAGATWSAANEGLTNVHVNSLAINSVDEIFSGTYFDGVFKSIDGGNNWNTVNMGLPDSAIVDAIAINSIDMAFAGLRSGEIFRSNDGGANWKEVFSGVGSIRSIFADSNDTIFMGALRSTYESRDDGNTWRQIGEFRSTTVSSFVQTQTSDLLAGTVHGVFRSTNSGLSWSLSGAGLPEPFPRVNTIIQASNGELVAGTQNHGFYRSVDGGINWAATGSDSPRLQIIELQHSSSDGLFAATDGGVLHSIDNGEIWAYRNEGLANSIVKAVIVSMDGSVYAGSGAGVARSTDFGLTWTNVSQGLPRASGVSALIELPGGDLLAGTESTEVYKSIDKGASWRPLGNLPAATGSVTAISRNSQGSLFLTTSRNTDATGVYRSTDGGSSWTAINNGISDLNLRSLAVNASDTLFTAGKGIYRSLDGGESWQLVHNSGNDIVWHLAVTPDAVLAATTAGVVQTIDGGASWSTVSGAPQSWIQSIAISDTGDAYLGFFNLQPTRPSVGQYRYELAEFIPVNEPFADDIRLTPLLLVIGPDGRVYAGLSGGGVAVR